MEERRCLGGRKDDMFLGHTQIPVMSLCLTIAGLWTSYHHMEVHANNVSLGVVHLGGLRGKTRLSRLGVGTCKS